MHPQVQMIDGHVRPDIAHLLLACAPHFFHVVEVLFDRCPVGECFERSEEHTSELQSRLHLVCRLLLEKKTRGERTPRRSGARPESGDVRLLGGKRLPRLLVVLCVFFTIPAPRASPTLPRPRPLLR